MHLIVGGHVHEHELVAFVIQELHVAGFEVRAIDLFAGTEGVVQHAAVEDVTQLGTYHSSAFAGLEVLEFDDFEGSPVDFDFKPLAEIRGGIHAASKNSAEYQILTKGVLSAPRLFLIRGNRTAAAIAFHAAAG